MIDKLEPDTRDCWSPKYRNDSRPWLIAPACNNAACGDAGGMLTTTNRVVFTHKCPDGMRPQRHVGRRRQLMEDQLWHQVSQQIKAELERCRADEALEKSEYAKQFAANEFTPSSVCDDVLQMKTQYPLYESVAQSVWMEKKKDLCGRTCTSLNEPNGVFHRSSAFSKPLHEILDLPKESSIGYK
ncbi:uncharacterized protein LOC111048536 isoform X2 [Nilaparvata lugens]|uniref:uncharacterized protein LOC111048536 isoform X2 n=1 Tax=Nilaparvata lugens TaxID=108931 RepID=UPI00193CF3A2|nr:uncharacterized protein LOC111048536 isoform X2 [Nilaparvata lugens]